MNNNTTNTTNIIDWDRTRELNARRGREAMEDGSYIAGWATVYKREPLEFAGVTPSGTPVRGQFTNEPVNPLEQPGGWAETRRWAEQVRADAERSGARTLAREWIGSRVDERESAAGRLTAEQLNEVVCATVDYLNKRGYFQPGFNPDTPSDDYVYAEVCCALEESFALSAPPEAEPLSRTAYDFAVKKGHSKQEAEAFARFVDKHPFSIRSNLPLNAETFDAAHAFAQAAVVKVELSEEAARRLEYLAKRPVVIPSPIMSAKSYQRVKDAASTRWEKAVWDAPDADLLAIAERYSPDEVDEYARSRVAGATGYSLMNGNGCPDAWLDQADEAVREHEELEQWEMEQSDD